MIFITEFENAVASMIMLCFHFLGSDKAVIVSEKHAVNSSPMKPPFPAGTELAMFGKHQCSMI